MIFISKYQKYFIIIFISAFLGLIRWAFLDRKFPLIPDQKITLDGFVSYQEISKIVKDSSLPIVDDGLFNCAAMLFCDTPLDFNA